jgi:4-azaleucine resistance transporter AzlC
VSERYRQVARGVRKAAPIALGYIPIALAFGALAQHSGMEPGWAVLMSILVFAGASQFMAVSMLLSGAGVIQVIAATFFLNLRHIVMSMTVMSGMHHVPQRWKLPLAFGVTDETFAILAMRQQAGEVRTSPYFAAALMGTAYISWVVGTAAGGSLGAYIPPGVSSSMSIALYAMFIGLLVPAVRRHLRVAAIAAAGMLLCYVLSMFMQHGWAVVLATVCSALLGPLLREEGPV